MADAVKDAAAMLLTIPNRNIRDAGDRAVLRRQLLPMLKQSGLVDAVILHARVIDVERRIAEASADVRALEAEYGAANAKHRKRGMRSSIPPLLRRVVILCVQQGRNIWETCEEIVSRVGQASRESRVGRELERQGLDDGTARDEAIRKFGEQD